MKEKREADEVQEFELSEEMQKLKDEGGFIRSIVDIKTNTVRALGFKRKPPMSAEEKTKKIKERFVAKRAKYQQALLDMDKEEKEKLRAIA